MPLVLESIPQPRFLDPHKRNRESAVPNSHFSSYVARKHAPLLLSESSSYASSTLQSYTTQQCPPFSIPKQAYLKTSLGFQPTCLDKNSSSPVKSLTNSLNQNFQVTLSKVDTKVPSSGSSNCSSSSTDSLINASHEDKYQECIQNTSTHSPQSPLTEQLDSRIHNIPRSKVFIPQKQNKRLSDNSSLLIDPKSPICNADGFPERSLCFSNKILPKSVATPVSCGKQFTLKNSRVTFETQHKTHVKDHSTIFSKSGITHSSALPIFKLLNTAVWKGSLIGQGFSSSVHRGVGIQLSESEGQVQKSEPIALKISDKVMQFTKNTTFSTVSREFEVLKLLYHKGVPVPKPISFAMYTDAKGSVQTILSMDLVDGLTLRDWINAQTNCVLHHKAIGRTIHPSATIESAIDRIDIALSLVDALQKLHTFGVFVDLKPRNIMVTRRTSSDTGIVTPSSSDDKEDFFDSCLPRWNVTLVDMGGVVLRMDLEPNHLNSSSLTDNTNTSGQASCWSSSFSSLDEQSCLRSDCHELTQKRNPQFENVSSTCMDSGISCFEEDLQIIPSLHRQFLETTCSYISPEVSAAIVTYDYLRNNFLHHFKPCLREFLCHQKDTSPPSPNALMRNAFQDLSVYLSQNGILYPKASNLHDTTKNDLQDRYVLLGQHSSIFSVGLILVELFGGLRTGLTGLCQFPVVSKWFSESSKHGGIPTDCEFRIALEWNIPQLPITVRNSPTPHENFDVLVLDRPINFNQHVSDEAKTSISDVRACSATNTSQVTQHGNRLSSFHDVFKQCCYPKQGILASFSCKESPTQFSENIHDCILSLEERYKKLMRQLSAWRSYSLFQHVQHPNVLSGYYSDCENSYQVISQQLRTLTHQIVEFILDNCLEFSPKKRFSYTTLRKALEILRHVIVAMR